MAAVKSSLTEPSTVTGATGSAVPRLKFLTAKPHCQEFERMVAVTCMVFDEQELKAQIDQDVLTFGTRAVPKTDEPRTRE